MRIWPVLSAALLLAAAGPALGAGPESSKHAVNESNPGYQAYRENCGACHGVFADGNGPVAQFLDPKPANLTKLYKRFGSPLAKAQLLSVIDGRDMVRAHGTSEMPIWGRHLYQSIPPAPGKEALKRGTLQIIIDYLQTIQEKQ
jgi:mono/diheme cytochrome c family protein